MWQNGATHQARRYSVSGPPCVGFAAGLSPNPIVRSRPRPAKSEHSFVAVALVSSATRERWRRLRAAPAGEVTWLPEPIPWLEGGSVLDTAWCVPRLEVGCTVLVVGGH